MQYRRYRGYDRARVATCRNSRWANLRYQVVVGSLEPGWSYVSFSTLRAFSNNTLGFTSSLSCNMSMSLNQRSGWMYG